MSKKKLTYFFLPWKIYRKVRHSCNSRKTFKTLLFNYWSLNEILVSQHWFSVSNLAPPSNIFIITIARLLVLTLIWIDLLNIEQYHMLAFMITSTCRHLPRLRESESRTLLSGDTLWLETFNSTDFVSIARNITACSYPLFAFIQSFL